MGMSATPNWLFNATLGIAGVSYYQHVVKTVQIGDMLVLAHSLTTKDPWAVGVYTKEQQLVGYLPKDLAKKLTNSRLGGTPGGRWEGVVTETTQYEDIKGLRIKVVKAWKTTQVHIKDITNSEEEPEKIYTQAGEPLGDIIDRTMYTLTVKTKNGTHVWPVNMLNKNEKGHYIVSEALARLG